MKHVLATTLATLAALPAVAAGGDGTPMPIATDPVAMACGAGTATAVPGGFVVTKQCDLATISGLGSTLGAADANANAFAAIHAAGGPACYTSHDSGTYVESGTVWSFNCGPRIVYGIGNTVTDTGTNALEMARIYADTGVSCYSHYTSISAFEGGLMIDYICQNGGTITGIGSTLTAAAANAVDFAQLGATAARRCSSDPTAIVLLPGGYELTVYCRGGSPYIVQAFGSTATEAGQNAFVAASL